MMLAALLGNKPDPNDAYARSQGFHDAATMQAYMQKRQQMLTGTSGGPSASSGSLLDSLHSALAIHPAFLLKSILDKWNAATGSQ